MGKIYLAGAITHSPDPSGWRERARVYLEKDGWEVLNPLDWEVKTWTAAEIIRLDYTLIMQSTAIICDCGLPSWGTAMELAYAGQHRIPVFGFKVANHISPWLEYHLFKRSKQLEKAIEQLNSWKASLNAKA